MSDKIDALLDELGITGATRELLRESIRAEMSVGLNRYLAAGGRVHTKEQCKATRKMGAPKGCVLHRPTLHKLTGRPQVLRSSTLIEDICEHGVGHPNPDSVAYLDWRDTGSTTSRMSTWGTHGCDGCCGPLGEEPHYLDRDGEW